MREVCPGTGSLHKAITEKERLKERVSSRVSIHSHVRDAVLSMVRDFSKKMCFTLRWEYLSKDRGTSQRTHWGTSVALLNQGMSYSRLKRVWSALSESSLRGIQALQTGEK